MLSSCHEVEQNWEFLISFYATFAPLAVPKQLIWKVHEVVSAIMRSCRMSSTVPP